MSYFFNLVSFNFCIIIIIRHIMKLFIAIAMFCLTIDTKCICVDFVGFFGDILNLC